MSRDQTHQQPGACTRVAHIKDALGFGQAADAAPDDTPCAAVTGLDNDAKGAESGGRPRHVLGFQKAADAAFADRRGTKNEGPVRNRLVPGNGNFPGDGLGKARDHRRHGRDFSNIRSPFGGIFKDDSLSSRYLHLPLRHFPKKNFPFPVFIFDRAGGSWQLAYRDLSRYPVASKPAASFADINGPR